MRCAHAARGESIKKNKRCYSQCASHDNPVGGPGPVGLSMALDTGGQEFGLAMGFKVMSLA